MTHQYKKYYQWQWKCGCSLTSCLGHHSVWMQFNVMPRTRLTCCTTENLLLIITPSALISSTFGMVETTGEGITTLRRHLGDTKTITIDLRWCRRRLFEEIKYVRDIFHFFCKRSVIQRWENQITRCHQQTLPSHGQVWLGEDLSLWWHKRLPQLPKLGWCRLRSRWTLIPYHRTLSSECELERSQRASYKCSQEIPSSSTCQGAQ